MLVSMGMDLGGLSTGKVMSITEALWGTNFSRSPVSSLGGKLDVELANWRTHWLDDAAYPYPSSTGGA